LVVIEISFAKKKNESTCKIFPKQSRKKKKGKPWSFLLSLCLTKKVFLDCAKKKKIFKKNKKMLVDAVFKQVPSNGIYTFHKTWNFEIFYVKNYQRKRKFKTLEPINFVSKI